MRARVPGAGWYVAAGLVALAGIVGAAGIVVAFVLSLGDATRFVAPGIQSLEVRSPGTYVIWHEHRTVYENRTYRMEPELPAGVRFTILAPDGSLVPLEPGGSQSWNEGDVARRAAGKFEARTAGRYSIALEGSFAPRVIAIARDFGTRLLGALGGAFLAAVVGVAGGIALAVYAFGLRADAARASGAGAAPRRAVPAPPESEPALRDMVTVVYALQAASPLVGITLIGGVIIDYLKRDEAAGTWLESHIRWQIRTFWWTLLWSVLGVLTVLVLVGFAILCAAAIWFIYRVAKGWTELHAGRPVGER